MIVYIVAELDYDDFTIKSVWSSEELAKAEADRLNDAAKERNKRTGYRYGPTWDWYDYEVDPTV